MANTIMHFEIPADDVARAKAFYEKTFGWRIKAFPQPAGAPEYFMVETRKATEPGINGGLMKRNMPGQPFTNYITVKSIDVASAAVQANGGVVVLPKQEIGQGMGWIAAFKDPENNIIGLHQAGAAMPPSGGATKKARAKKAPAKKAAKRRRR
jgi:predicted enzyme related to lactoylglutathione lyase